MSEVPIEGKVVGQIGEATYYTVSGRGYGKRAAQLAILNEIGDTIETGYAVQEPSIDKGSGWGNFTAQISFTRETPASSEAEMKDLWRSLMLGRGWPPYGETPREELRRRLNTWLRGGHPGEPINWKGLS